MKIEIGSKEHQEILELAKKGKNKINYKGIEIPIEAILEIENKTKPGDTIEIENIEIHDDNEKFVQSLIEKEKEIQQMITDLKPDSKMKFHFVATFLLALAEKHATHVSLMTPMLDDEMMKLSDKVYESYK